MYFIVCKVRCYPLRHVLQYVHECRTARVHVLEYMCRREVTYEEASRGQHRNIVRFRLGCITIFLYFCNCIVYFTLKLVVKKIEVLLFEKKKPNFETILRPFSNVQSEIMLQFYLTIFFIYRPDVHFTQFFFTVRALQIRFSMHVLLYIHLESIISTSKKIFVQEKRKHFFFEVYEHVSSTSII